MHCYRVRRIEVSVPGSNRATKIPIQSADQARLLALQVAPIRDRGRLGYIELNLAARAGWTKLADATVVERYRRIVEADDEDSGLESLEWVLPGYDGAGGLEIGAVTGLCARGRQRRH